VSFLHSRSVILAAFLFLDLDSSYEWNHVMFVFLNLAYFIQYDDLQFQPFSYKENDFILSG
jgi:hypothetical protein